MAHALDERVRREVLDHTSGVLRVAVEPERERLDALEQQERVEGRDGRAGVAQKDRPDVGDESRRSRRLRERHAVVAGIGRGDGRELAARGPIEGAGVDDHAAEGRAVPAEELGGRVHHDVGAVLDRAHPVGGPEGVVDHERDVMRVRDLGERVDVGNVGAGVSERLQEERLGVGADGGLHLRMVVGVDEARLDAELRERVGEQVERAAVDGLLRDHVVAGLGERLQRVGDRGGAACRGQRRDASLERGDAPLEHVLRGVGEAAVDVAGIGEAEAVGRVLGVVEDVGSRLVDGHRAGVGGGVGALLADVELQGLELVVTHGCVPSRMRLTWARLQTPRVRCVFRSRACGAGLSRVSYARGRAGAGGRLPKHAREAGIR